MYWGYRGLGFRATLRCSTLHQSTTQHNTIQRNNQRHIMKFNDVMGYFKNAIQSQTLQYDTQYSI